MARRATHRTTDGTQLRGILSLLVALSLLGSGCGYNSLVQQREAIDAQWAQVENQLQRRNDLIPNLVEVTKGYAKHEEGIFTAIANARSKLLSAGTRDEKVEASNEVSGALGRLLALSEAYPNLKADAQFARLSDEIAGTENRIATERRRYNEEVKTYNSALKQIPTTFYAGCMGFKAEKYFEAPEAAKAVPKVQF